MGKIKLGPDKVRIIASGRGRSMRETIRKTEQEGVWAFDRETKPREAMLVLVQINKIWWPFLLYPDGTGEMAIEFEEQDEKGEWKKLDLVKISDPDGKIKTETEQ